MMCVWGSLRGGERQQRSGLEAAAEAAGPGGATAAGKPRHPATEGRRLRGHSLRYLPAGKEDKEAVGTQPEQARRCQQRRSPRTHRCVVVKTDVRTSSVSRSLHQLTLLRAVRWAWVGSQGGGGRDVGGKMGGKHGAGGEPAAGRAGAGYSVSPSAAAGPPHTGCTAASRPPRTEGWCWSVSARGTAWRGDRGAETWKFAPPRSHRPAHALSRPRPSDTPRPSP